MAFYYCIECDKCKTRILIENGTRQLVSKQAGAAGWHQTIEGKHYCKECFAEAKNK